MLTDFTNQYKAEIKGKSKEISNVVNEELKLSTGSIVKSMFEELYEDYADKNFRISADIRDDEIERAIKNHQGDSIPGFPSIHAFMFLLTPKLQSLKEPALDLLSNVYTELRKLTGELITSIAVKAPAIMDEMINEADAFLLQLKNKTEEIILANIDSEISYIFTNDEDYLHERTKLIPVDKENKKDGKKEAGEPAEPKRGNINETKNDR